MGLQDANGLLLIIFILFFACICTPTSSQSMSSPVDEDAGCGTENCGMGTCRETSGLVPGYVCDCSPGWTKPQFSGFAWPSCIMPNCTINYQCGGEPPLPLPLPPPPIQLPPPINSSLSCLIVWCGDGECVASGSSYECQCHQGSANLMGSPTLPCLQQCNLGVDCNKTGFGLPATLLPSPPPSKPSTSLGNGESSPPKNDATNYSKDYRALSWMLLTVIVISWI